MSRSSSAVARTFTGPGPVCDVSRTARLPVVVSLPPLELKRTVTGRLSALATSQEMVARSPARRVFGEALHVMVGGLEAPALAAAGEAGCVGVMREDGDRCAASPTSISSTPSAMSMSSYEVGIMAVAL